MPYLVVLAGLGFSLLGFAPVVPAVRATQLQRFPDESLTELLCRVWGRVGTPRYFLMCFAIFLSIFWASRPDLQTQRFLTPYSWTLPLMWFLSSMGARAMVRYSPHPEKKRVISASTNWMLWSLTIFLVISLVLGMLINKPVLEMSRTILW